MEAYFEKQIIEAAIKAFQKNLGGQFGIALLECQPRAANEVRADALVRVKFPAKETTYYLEVKKRVTGAVIGNLLMRKRALAQPLLLITDHVTGHMADRLKKEGIEFLDAAGNGFIDQPPVYIFIKGNKRADLVPNQAKNQTFNATGLKVIFAFFYDENLLNAPYRQIAQNAGVALGAVGWIMRDLVAKEYVMEMRGKERKLLRKEKLFDRWKDAFTENLKPKLLLGKFAGNADWWREARFDNKKAQWAGEIAAAKLTKFLKPERITLYIDDNYLDDILLDNKLRRDPQGDVEIYKRFWTIKENDANETVPAFLVYAELIATGEERNIEVAKDIFDEYVAGYIRQG